MRFCLIDFETASACDLKKAGAWRYAEDPTTEILCLGYDVNGAGGHVIPAHELPYRTREHVIGYLEECAVNPDCIFVAHNVAFEKAIWRNIMVPVYGWPDIPDERWHDIMAVCAMKGLPLKLERATKVLGLAEQKDMEGSHVTRSLSRADKAGNLNRSPALLERVYEYNASDLRVELCVHRRVRGLGEGERRVWLLDQRINQRGVRLDIDFIEKAQQIVDHAAIPLAKEFEALTGVRAGQRDKFLAWLQAEGCKIDNLQKETVAHFLAAEDDESLAGDEDDFQPREQQLILPFRAERALRIRQVLGSASIKKLGAMRSCVCADGRARGLLQYHGAGPGRWAGRLLQPQNFPRPTLKQVVGFDKNGLEVYGGHDPEALVAAIKTGDAEYVRCMFGEPIEAVSNALRHALISSEGRVFAVGDYAKIECVVVLALAGATETAATVLQNGSAVYTDMATQIFKFPVKKTDLKEYTIGKNSILGCGFQMGHKKFRARYWKDADEDQAKEVIRIYREDFAPEVPLFWRGLEEASTRTAWTGQAHMAYGITYALEDGWMTARLPSGRKLWYYNPKPVRKAMPWDKNDIRPGWEYSANKTGKWIRVSAYGGLLVENVVQATARDLLVNGLFQCEAAGYETVLTVHDEDVAEIDSARANVTEFKQLLVERPAWAKGLQIPVDADCWIGERYRK